MDGMMISLHRITDRLEDFRIPQIEELHVGMEVEIYDQATSKLMKDLRWHPVKISATNNEIGEYVAFNRIPQLLKNGKLRIRNENQKEVQLRAWKNQDVHTGGIPSSDGQGDSGETGTCSSKG